MIRAYQLIWTSFILIFLTLNINAQNIPKPLVPKQIVNDYIPLLNTGEKRQLEHKLVKYNDTSSTQIAVVIIETTEGYPISEYAFKLGEDWGVGQKGLDNGIVLLVAKEDRKVFIATGYGVEDVVPDVLAKRIIENYIVPEFKNGNFYRGIDKGTDVLVDLTTGKYSSDDIDAEEIPVAMILFIILVIVIFLFMFSKMSSNGSATVSRRGTTYHDGGWWTTTGGGGGGGFSGGGFGGFGGGSFGGGGAGGSW